MSAKINAVRWGFVAHEVQRIVGQQADQIKRKVWKALFS